MAKVGAINIPSGFEVQYKKVFQDVSTMGSPRVRRKTLFVSRKRKAKLLGQSLIPQLAPVWAAYPQNVCDAWNAAGLACNLTGWQLFVRDTALRNANGLTGYSTPNTICQAEVGHIAIDAPATAATIAQLHPQHYFVARRVRGTRSQYAPVAVQEDFALPLTIALSWHTELTAAGAHPRARFYCVVRSINQGHIVQTVCEVPMGLTDAWQRGSATISSVIGVVRGYTAFIEAIDVQGEIYFDNVSLQHSGHDWARDPACINIRQAFTKKLHQVPAHWVGINMPEGAFFDSEYYTD